MCHRRLESPEIRSLSLYNSPPPDIAHSIWNPFQAPHSPTRPGHQREPVPNPHTHPKTDRVLLSVFSKPVP
jgi:hypothetical protein